MRTSGEPSSHLSVLMRIGTGRDVYHAWELAAYLTAAGTRVHAVLSPEAADALAPSRWIEAVGCSEVTTSSAEDAVAAADFDAVLELCGCRGHDTPTAPTVRVSECGPGRAPRFAVSRSQPGARLASAEACVASESGGPGGYVASIIDALRYVRAGAGDLAGKRIVVTAGGTRELIDPVRCITNRSSGKMGLALARAARDRGADVVLVTTAGLPDEPTGTRARVAPDTATLREAVLSEADRADVVIMAAAVSDFRPSRTAARKIKKGPEGLKLDLELTDDFIHEIPLGVLRVGFAAETGADPDAALDKLNRRGFHLLCLNDVSQPGSGFETDTNKVWILDASGVRAETELMPKYLVGHAILDEIVEFDQPRPTRPGEEPDDTA